MMHMRALAASCALAGSRSHVIVELGATADKQSTVSLQDAGHLLALGSCLIMCD